MALMKSREPKIALSSRRIAAIYVVVGIVWILVTSFFVSGYSDATEDLLLYEIGKGLFFVVASGFLLWFLCHKWEKQVVQAALEGSEAMKELDEARREAESANRVKSDFLAVMSHELRTPLNPIMGYTSLLLEEVEDPSLQDPLRDIMNSSRRMLHLIDDLLFFSYFNEHQRVEGVEVFELLPLVEKSVSETRRTFPNGVVVVENGFGDFAKVGAEDVFEDHPELLGRVLHELLSNGVKFGEGKPVYLRLGAKEKEGSHPLIRFEVEDSGIGMPQEFIDKIYDPFSQADTSQTRRYQGVGLGLSICRKIADFLEAELEGRSFPGEGAKFSFQFLLPRVEIQEKRKSVKQRVEESSFTDAEKDRLNRVEGDAIDSRSPCALVVEDDPLNARLARKELELFGFEVEVASDGEEAVEKCELRVFDLILMDICLPRMNGFEASEAILGKDGKNAGTPIFALTALVEEEARLRCKEIGMQGFVSKPVRMEDLRSVLAIAGFRELAKE